jgi:hypothetical protein
LLFPPPTTTTDFLKATMTDCKAFLRKIIFDEPYATATKFGGFFLFYLITTMVYCLSLEKDWTVVQAVYFITVTLSTCGYGQLHPSSEASKIFTIFVIIFGVGFVFLLFTGPVSLFLVHSQEGIILTVMGKRTVDEIHPSTMRVYKVVSCVFAITMMAMSGMAFYAANENWPLLDGAYWSVSTLATVGYGDIAILYDSTRIFGIFFILLTVVLYATSANTILEIYKEGLDWSLNDDVEAADAAAKWGGGGGGGVGARGGRGRFSDAWVDRVLAEQTTSAVERSNFVLLVLEEKGLIDRARDVKPLLAYFDSVDRMRLGFITKQDLLDYARSQRDQQEEMDDALAVGNPLHAYYAPSGHIQEDTATF